MGSEGPFFPGMTGSGEETRMDATGGGGPAVEEMAVLLVGNEFSSLGCISQSDDVGVRVELVRLVFGVSYFFGGLGDSM